MAQPRLLPVIVATAFALSTSAQATASFPLSHSLSVKPGADLRSIVEAANRLGGVNRIELAPGSYSLANIPYQHNQIVVRGNLTISTRRPGTCVINGAGGDRLFEVMPGARLTLIGLTLQGGLTLSETIPLNNSMEVEPGGAILNRGTLTIVKCTIQRCSTGATDLNEFVVGSGKGGGIYNLGSLVMTDSVITQNTCGPYSDGGSGGGIFNCGTAMLFRTTVSFNVADAGNYERQATDGGDGGGICNTGTMFLQSCIVDDNKSGPGGDSVEFYDDFGGEITPAGRGGFGGGIFNSGNLMANDSVVGLNETGSGGNNIQPDSDTGQGGSGGGIYNSGVMRLTRTAVDWNLTRAGGTGADGEFDADEFDGEFQVWANNAPGRGGNGGDGAGICNAGRLTMTLCTVGGNLCEGGGPGGSSHVVFYTDEGSTPAYPPGGDGGQGGNGAGIFNSGSMTALSCTVAYNVAGPGGNGGNADLSGPPSHVFGGNGGDAGDGGGLFNTETATISVTNTIVAGNVATLGGLAGTGYSPVDPPGLGRPGYDGFGPDYEGSIDSGGFNLVGVDDGSGGFVNAQPTDLIGTPDAPLDPMLDGIDQIGELPTMYVPRQDSPAIDNGNSFALKTDARSAQRVHDLPTISNAAGGDGADIGAVELQ